MLCVGDGTCGYDDVVDDGHYGCECGVSVEIFNIYTRCRLGPEKKY